MATVIPEKKPMPGAVPDAPGAGIGIIEFDLDVLAPVPLADSVTDPISGKEGPENPKGDGAVMTAPGEGAEAELPAEVDVPGVVPAVGSEPVNAPASPPKDPKPEGAIQGAQNFPTKERLEVEPPPWAREKPFAIEQVDSGLPLPITQGQEEPPVGHEAADVLVKIQERGRAELSGEWLPVVHTAGEAQTPSAVEPLLTDLPEVPGSDPGLPGQALPSAVVRVSDGAALPDGFRPVSAQVVDAVRSQPKGEIELTLRPEDLGTVKLKVTPTEQGVVVYLAAERVETMDLMRRNLEILLNDFRSLGLGTLAFSFGSDRKGAEFQRSLGPKTGGRFEEDPRENVPEPKSGRLLTGRLDMRV